MKRLAPTSMARLFERGLPTALGMGIALGVIALYWRVGGYDFILFDDPLYVSENPHVRTGLSWDNVRWAFGAFGYASNWHPLTWLSHMLDVELFGLNPAGHHRTSVLFHALSSALLFILMRRMFREGGTAGPAAATWAGGFAAALFALHPLRVESVAWVAERKDVVSALLWILSTAAYLAYARRGGAGRYAVVVVLMAVGLLAKPMLVTLPAVLLLLDLWPLRRLGTAGAGIGGVRLIAEKVPLLALSALSAAATLHAQGGQAVSSVRILPLSARFANALVSCFDYIAAFFWPRGLGVFYPFPVGGVPPWKAALSGALLGALSVIAISAWRRLPWLTVGWLWYLVTLLPVIGLIQVGVQARADRYTYLPQIGLCLIAAAGVLEVARRFRIPRAAWAGAGLACVVACGACTARQIGYWRDSETLIARALAVTTDNYWAHHAMAVELARQGRSERALDHLVEAVRIYPAYASAHRELGSLLSARGETDRALAHLRTAVALKPRDHRAHLHLGWVYVTIGRDEEARSEMEEAVRIRPEDAEARFGLGLSSLRTGSRERAVEQYERLVDLDPERADRLRELILGTEATQPGE